LRVLLVNANLRHDLFAAAPIGLCYVASAARAAGHDVAVLDLCFSRTPRSDLQGLCSSFLPEVIGLSIRNIDNVNMLHPVNYMQDTEMIVRWIRESSDAPLVIGGSGASLLPREMTEKLQADFVVVADGEISFPQLINAISSRQSFGGIPGVGYLNNGDFALVHTCLESFPNFRPALGEWVNFSDYARLGAGYSIQSYRGCSHDCIYCLYSLRIQGKRIRLRHPVDVVDEIEEAILRYRPRSFEFVDSLFNDPIDHCFRILEELERRPWRAVLSATSLTPRNLNRDLLDLMWRVGFRSFHLSPESASSTMLRNYGKPFSSEDVTRAAELIMKTRFKVLWFFMVGGPGETRNTFQETLDFCSSYLRNNGKQCTQVANIMLGVRLYPGTRLWNIAQAEGIVNSSNEPLSQLWYFSSLLNVRETIDQMVDAAVSMPEIISGLDERFMRFSGIMSWFSRMFGSKCGYWSSIFHANRLLRRALLPLVFDRRRVVARIEEQLLAQNTP